MWFDLAWTCGMMWYDVGSHDCVWIVYDTNHIWVIWQPHSFGLMCCVRARAYVLTDAVCVWSSACVHWRGERLCDLWMVVLASAALSKRLCRTWLGIKLCRRLVPVTGVGEPQGPGFPEPGFWTNIVHKDIAKTKNEGLKKTSLARANPTVTAPRLWGWSNGSFEVSRFGARHGMRTGLRRPAAEATDPLYREIPYTGK